MKSSDIASRLIAWTFSGVCLLIPLTYGIKLSTILFFIAGVLALPLPPIKKLWNTVCMGNPGFIKPLTLAIIFLIALSLLPTSDFLIDTTIPETNQTAATDNTTVSSRDSAATDITTVSSQDSAATDITTVSSQDSRSTDTAKTPDESN